VGLRKIRKGGREELEDQKVNREEERLIRRKSKRTQEIGSDIYEKRKQKNEDDGRREDVYRSRKEGKGLKGMRRTWKEWATLWRTGEEWGRLGRNEEEWGLKRDKKEKREWGGIRGNEEESEGMGDVVRCRRWFLPAGDWSTGSHPLEKAQALLLMAQVMLLLT
jgi:hypothetical protein